jgi:hypothetical protein
MAIALRKEVVDRLLMTKSLLSRIRGDPSAEPDRYAVAEQILISQDAAELALGAIADQLGKLPQKGKYYLMDYFDSLREAHPEKNVEGKEFLRQLNEARIGIKHIGNFPDPKQWARVGERIFERISKWCGEYLGVSLDDLDESALLKSVTVKAYFDSAKAAMTDHKYEEVLIQIGKALHTVFDENSALFGFDVGIAKPEDAIRLAGFGVHANDYLALQEFLPEIDKGSEGRLRHKWKQGQFGHPGNWRKDAAEFCLSAFLDVALKIQDARWIPGAVRFDTLYKFRITALRDGVEVWTYREKPQRGGSGLAGLSKLLEAPPSKEPYRVLNKGDSLWGRVEAVRSDSPQDRLRAALGGGPLPIAVIKITTFKDPRIAYVAADAVKVTCVPRESWKEYIPDLPEIEWTPDQGWIE